MYSGVLHSRQEVAALLLLSLSMTFCSLTAIPKVGVDAFQPSACGAKASCKPKVAQLQHCRLTLVQEGIVQLEVPAGQLVSGLSRQA